MRQEDIKELLELQKKFKLKLTETMQITQDLAETVERQDTVSMEMLISSRQKSILEMQEVQSFISLKRLDLSPPDLARMDALLSGAMAETPDEAPLVELIASNQRFLDQLIDIDRIINQKLCGTNSAYA